MPYTLLANMIDHPNPEENQNPLEQAPSPYDLQENPTLQEDSQEDGLKEWKDRLRQDFEACLYAIDSMEDIPLEEEEGEEHPPETPDLYSFYALWAAGQAETRKANRRTVEAFGQWSEISSRLEAELRLMREQRMETAANHDSSSRRKEEDAAGRALCLSLVELADRLGRVAKAFESAPPRTWWGGDAVWRKAWETQQKAFEILIDHFEALLEQQGLTRLQTVGQIFDPALMVATAADRRSDLAHHMVLEETSSGFYRQGELLRPAQVKVNNNK